MKAKITAAIPPVDYDELRERFEMGDIAEYLRRENSYYANQRSGFGLRFTEIERDIRLAVGWLTSGENYLSFELTRRPDGEVSRAEVFAEGRRHGIPWWFADAILESLGITDWRDEASWVYEESRRLDLAPWEASAGDHRRDLDKIAPKLGEILGEHIAHGVFDGKGKYAGTYIYPFCEGAVYWSTELGDCYARAGLTIGKDGRIAE